MDRPLIPIRNAEDLKKILFIQKTVTEQAKNEMLAVATDGIQDPKTAKAFIAEERKLLEKYANYPTLTEFAESPDLTNGAKWGATFGVTILVGGLIIKEVETRLPHMKPVLRHMVMLLLKELHKPEHRYLIEPLENNLKMNSKSMAQGQQSAVKRQIVMELADVIIGVGARYGLMTKKDGTVMITPVGRRVLFHMVDAQRFIDEMSKAHAHFQAIKPRLSMV